MLDVTETAFPSHSDAFLQSLHDVLNLFMHDFMRPVAVP